MLISFSLFPDILILESQMRYLLTYSNKPMKVHQSKDDQVIKLKWLAFFFTFYVFRKIGLNPFFKLTPSFFIEELKLFQKIVYSHCDGQ